MGEGVGSLEKVLWLSTKTEGGGEYGNIQHQRRKGRTKVTNICGNMASSARRKTGSRFPTRRAQSLETWFDFEEIDILELEVYTLESVRQRNRKLRLG